VTAPVAQRRHAVTGAVLAALTLTLTPCLVACSETGGGRSPSATSRSTPASAQAIADGLDDTQTQLSKITAAMQIGDPAAARAGALASLASWQSYSVGLRTNDAVRYLKLLEALNAAIGALDGRDPTTAATHATEFARAAADYLVAHPVTTG